MNNYQDFEALFAYEDAGLSDDRAENIYDESFAGSNILRPPFGETGGSATSPIVIPNGFRMGVWLDVGGRSLTSHGSRHAALLHDLGIADASLMINRVDARQFGFSSVSEAAIRRFASLLSGSGTKLTLTSWLRPQKQFIDDLVRALPPLARDVGAHAIEVDVEETWTRGRVRGFANHTEAAEYFFRTLRAAATGMEIAVTCQVDVMPTTKMRAIVAGADVVIPQAYSAYRPRSSHRVGGVYGPRGIQDRALQKMRAAAQASGKSVIMGLAAYSRHRWPGQSAASILRMELEHTLSLRAQSNLQGARYWSWKWIAGTNARGGRPANSYSLPFLRTGISSPGANAAWSGTSNGAGSATASRPSAPQTPAMSPSPSPGPSPNQPPQSQKSHAGKNEAWERVERQFRSARFQGDAKLQAVLNGRRFLRRGSRGSDVRKVQQALIDLGHPLPRFGTDGKFGSETKRALRDFQRSQNIQVDGVVGPQTMGKLDDAIAARTPTNPPIPVPPVPIVPPATGRVLQTARVEMPLTRQSADAAKIYDPATDTTTLRATNRRGASIDLASYMQNETRERLRRYRQIHPNLFSAMQGMGDNDRLPIMAWIFHEYEEPRKDDGGDAPLVASENNEMSQLPGSFPYSGNAYTAALRASVSETLGRARSSFQSAGVNVTADLSTIPVLVAEATKAQINSLSQLTEVTGLYLYDPEGHVSLSSSISDARAAPAHTAGFKGANISVAIWEGTPNSTSNLSIEDTFDSTAAASQSTARKNHAQLVTAIVKNTQSSGSKGFAPDAKIFSANNYTNNALVWAIETKQCTVLNQSFTRSGARTASGLDPDDLFKDYLVTKPPYPTIVQAAGNGPDTEYVNHKGFNCITVGNHVDGAGSMRHTTVFRNPASAHNDRDLPDLSANGVTVTATGLTNTGTSFASPAVAGTAAVIQSTDRTLTARPEGCRAILLASASRNIDGSTWVQDAQSSSADGVDGSGALDTNEAVQITRVRRRRNASATRRGWDVGMFQSSDVQSNGNSNFVYRVQVPASGARRLKAALAWNSKVKYTSDASQPGGVRVTESKLTVDLDLYVYRAGSSVLEAQSSTFDSSFEIVEFDAQAGASYDIKIKRFSGNDWVWYGLAWTVI